MWFEVAAGPKSGTYTGWFSFDRTDRVLALTGLAAVASAFLPPSKIAAGVRALLGVLALGVIAREIAVPPVIDPGVALGRGAYAGLAGALAIGLGALTALEPLRRRLPGRRALRPLAALRWARGEPEPERDTGGRRPGSTLGRGVLRGVPSISPGALGLFRIALGVALTLFVVRYLDLAPLAAPADDQQGSSWFAAAAPVRLLAASPDAVSAVRMITLAALALFVVGLFSRVAYAVAAAGLTATALAVIALFGSDHSVGLPTVALLCLLVAPWQDSGLGLDALIRARRGRALPDAPSRRYGIAVWVPGLAMGVALLAAAYAKMRNSGYEWVTGAAVKYHFVEDAGRAPVDWALRLTSVEEIAVLMALFAFLVEAGFILVVLSPRPAVRLGFGLVAASLLTGFYLFQGVFWPGWWTLLLAFLPWEELYRGGLRLAGAARPPSDADAPAVPLAGALRVATLALVVLLLAQQVVVSGARAEQEPLLSSYPMYRTPGTPRRSSTRRTTSSPPTGSRCCRPRASAWTSRPGSRPSAARTR